MVSPGEEETRNTMSKRKSSSNLELNAEKDTEEYRKLRERNNEAVKKSRTRTKLRTQATLEKVEKLRQDNSSLEGKIEGLKKELDILKEFFVSHAGTKSMKRLTEVDLEVLLAEAASANKKKKGPNSYTGRSRELIERQVQALLGQQDEHGNDEVDDGTALDPSTSQADLDNSSASLVAVESTPVNGTQVGTIHELIDHQVITSQGFMLEDGAENALWTTESGESVVVTISDDGQVTTTSAAGTVQQDLHATFINDQLVMLE